jgi:hypothetical protein
MVAIFYLTLSSGLAMNIHYCMGKISSITFGHEKDHNDGSCNKCGMSKTENHCCSDDVEFLKLTDSHQATDVQTCIETIAMSLPVTDVSLQESGQGNTIEPVTHYFSLPLPVHNKVYLAINVFRI